MKSYRSTLGSLPSLQVHSERSMCTLTMNENVFVLLEDPTVPTRADIVTNIQNSQSTDEQVIPVPPHYRTTFLTLRPPSALEQLLHQLRAHWIPVRQTAPGAQRSQGGQQLSVEGFVFAIGNDWLVRVGNVVLAGGAVKGMLLEVI